MSNLVFREVEDTSSTLGFEPLSIEAWTSVQIPLSEEEEFETTPTTSLFNLLCFHLCA